MMDRREWLKMSLLGGGAAVAQSAFHAPLVRTVLAETDRSPGPVVETQLGTVRGVSAGDVYHFQGYSLWSIDRGRDAVHAASAPEGLDRSL